MKSLMFGILKKGRTSYVTVPLQKDGIRIKEAVKTNKKERHCGRPE